MIQGYIYKLTLLQDTENFKKGEVYIGKHNGKNPYYFSGGKIVKKLINKYSKNIFERNIIQENINSIELLDLLEIYWIFYFNSNRNRFSIGLNLTDGGDGGVGKIVTQETKNKISKALLGKFNLKNRKPKSIEARINMSIGQKGKQMLTLRNVPLTENHRFKIGKSNKNKKRTDLQKHNASISHLKLVKTQEHKDNISKALKGKRVYDNRKSIIKIDKNTLEETTYTSISEASIKNNILITSIINCLKGLSKTAGKFIWKYKL